MTAGGYRIHPHRSASIGPLVVARRWDRLGARLNAIVNARAMAELFGLEFRFVWPRGPAPELSRPEEIFGSGFLDGFEIQPRELEHRTPRSVWELMRLTDSDARRALSTAGTSAFLEVDEILDIVRGATESITAARERFRRSFDGIDWSDDVRRLIDFCSAWPAGGAIAAVHVRAGDIVTGAWRHVVIHEKYSPTPFIDEAVERLAEGGTRQVLILSDNAPYLAWLKDKFPTVITTTEILPDHPRLTELQQALADILILSRCELIVGPPSSAFSRLGANLGAGKFVRADALVEAGQEREVLCSGIDAHRQDADTSGLWGGLIARDICWCLDVFGDTLALGEQDRLARRALELDPEFSGALTRFARIAALGGDWRSASGAAALAVWIAESAERNDDPLMEALATDVALKCFAVVRGRIEPGSVTEPSLAEIRTTFNRCLRLHPFWLVREEIFDSLRYLIATAEQLSGEGPGVRRRAARSLAKARYDDIDIRRLRPGGLEHHRAVVTYDPLTRDLERMGFHLYEAVRRAGLATETPRLAAGLLRA